MRSSLVLIYELCNLLILLILRYFASSVEHASILEDVGFVDALVELLHDLDVEDLELVHAGILRLLRDQLRWVTPVEPWRDLAPLELPLDLVLADTLISRLLRQVREGSLLERLR